MPEKYLIKTSPGLEDLLLQECRENMGYCSLIREGKGWVLVETRGNPVIYIDNARLPTRMTHVLFYRTYNSEKEISLEQIYEDLKKVSWEDYFLEKTTFAVRTERYGNHVFTSPEIANISGQAIKDYFDNRKITVSVHLGAPNIVVDVFLYMNLLAVGISLTGDYSIHRRWYRIEEHTASLKPNIAFAMIMLSGMREGEILLDPVCGGATIPIEALTYFETSKAICNDKIKKNLSVGIRNSIAAGVNDRITFMNKDVSELISLKLDFQHIIANPPYGLRLGRPVVARKTLENIFKLFSEQGNKDSRLTIVYPHKKTILELGESFSLEKYCEKWVMHGNLDVWITCFRKK